MYTNISWGMIWKHSKMSDEDIIRLLLTKSGLVTLSRNSMLFTERASTVTAEEEWEGEISVIYYIPGFIC